MCQGRHFSGKLTVRSFNAQTVRKTVTTWMSNTQEQRKCHMVSTAWVYISTMKPTDRLRNLDSGAYAMVECVVIYLGMLRSALIQVYCRRFRRNPAPYWQMKNVSRWRRDHLFAEFWSCIYIDKGGICRPRPETEEQAGTQIRTSGSYDLS
jgi:hypothetical protein